MQVFVSHATTDDEIVTRIYHEVKEASSCELWVDHLELIPPITDFRQNLHKALKTSNAGLLILSRNAIRRPEIDGEWNWILATQRDLFVAKIDDLPLEDIDARLTVVQGVDLHQDWDHGIAILIAGLEGKSKLKPISEVMGGRTSSTARPSPKTTDRNREQMLKNVRSFWVENVLEKSLYNEVRLELGMESKLDAVENPWDTILQHHEYGDCKLPPSTRIVDVFQSMNGSLLILGEPGSGKTTTLLELARDLIDRALTDETQPIPVVFNLSSWAAQRKSLADWLTDELNIRYQIPKKVAEVWVKNDTLLLLLDGLDEVDTHYRDDCVGVINTFRSDHGFVPMVVCSRIADYEALTTKLRLQGAIVLQPLTAEQIDGYLTALGAEVKDLKLNIQQQGWMQELAKEPLMLSIMVLAYRDIPSENRGLTFPITFPISFGIDLEIYRKHLFATYVERAFLRRGKSTRYTIEQTLHYLIWLTKQMAAHQQSVFQIERLQLDWLPRGWEQWAGTLAGRLTGGLVFGLVLGLFGGLAGTLLGGLASGQVLGLFGGLAGALFLGLIVGPGQENPEVDSVEIITVEFGKLVGGLGGGFGVGLRVGLRFGLVFGLLIGLFYGIAGALAGVLDVGLSVGLVNGLLIGLFVDLVFGLVLGLFVGLGEGIHVSENVQSRMRPNEGIVRSMWNALRVGAVLGVLTTPIGFFIEGIEQGICAQSKCGLEYFHWTLARPNVDVTLLFGVIAALAAGLWFGGRAIILHNIIRFLLCRRGSIPSNYAEFLNYAASLNILRKVGGGYIFIHRYLLEYFASLETPPAKSE